MLDLPVSCPSFLPPSMFTRLVVWYWDKREYLVKTEDEMWLGIRGWEGVCLGENAGAIVGRKNCVRTQERAPHAWCAAVCCGWRRGCVWDDGGDEWRCGPASVYRRTLSPTWDTALQHSYSPPWGTRHLWFPKSGLWVSERPRGTHGCTVKPSPFAPQDACFPVS